MSKKEKLAAVRVTAPRYQKASRKRKGLILDEFVALTEYNRKYAAWLLTKQGSKTLIGKNIKLKCDVRKSAGKKRSSVYNQVVVTSLVAIWYKMDCVCGKRLAPMLKDIIPVLEKHHEIQLDEEPRTKLLKISAATIDRLLKHERKNHTLKGRSHTKPGTLLTMLGV